MRKTKKGKYKDQPSSELPLLKAIQEHGVLIVEARAKGVYKSWYLKKMKTNDMSTTQEMKLSKKLALIDVDMDEYRRNATEGSIEKEVVLLSFQTKCKVHCHSILLILTFHWR